MPPWWMQSANGDDGKGADVAMDMAGVCIRLYGTTHFYLGCRVSNHAGAVKRQLKKYRFISIAKTK